jgi:DNA-binding NtrC family response regulator
MPKKLPRRVLVVDDELLMRWSIAETLKAHGDTVLEAENGVGALRAPVDVVVLDYRLPDTTNLSLLPEIRRIAPTTPVIVMTACGTPELTEGTLRLGAYDVMDKPFDLSTLEAMVSRACEVG